MSEDKNPLIFLRNLFITGLLVLVPLGTTYFIVSKIFDLTDRTIREILKPSFDQICYYLFNKTFAIPPYGIGLIVTILMILGVGVLARNFVGRRLIHTIEKMMLKLPLINRIYIAAKQISENVLHREKNIFQGVVLVEYPRKGIFSIGFVTSFQTGPIHSQLPEPCATVFVSTTPNPTSGILIIVPLKDLKILEISVEDAMKLVISAGVLIPEQLPESSPLHDEIKKALEEFEEQNTGVDTVEIN